MRLLTRLTFLALLLASVVQAPAHASQALSTPGLRAQWSWGTSHATNIGQIDWADSDETTVVADVNWAPTHDPFLADRSADSFALRLTGRINITADGGWGFTLSSDESAALWIDGELVIDDGDAHSYRSLSGSKILTTGYHDIEIRFREGSWSAGLVLEWTPPGGSTEVVPASAFDHLDAPPDSSSGGLKAYWTSGVSHATELAHIDWYKYTVSNEVDNISWRITHDAFYTDGPTDSFAGRFVGKITIPETGTWTFNLGSDEAASLLIDGQEVVYDGATHSYRWTAGAVSLTAGVHDIDVRFLERSWSAGLFLTWKGPSDTRESVVPRSALTVGTDTDFGESGSGGLRAYWSSGLSHATNLGHVDWDSYDLVSDVGRVSWSLTHGAFHDDVGTDSFGVRLLGYIDIPESGSWTFHLGSDEAAGVWINGVAVAHDPTTHSFRWVDGSVSLAAGLHEIEIRFLERSWSAGLLLAWEGPSDSHAEIIPASAFTARDIPPGAFTGEGVRAYWTTGASHATALGHIDWDDYDATTDEERVAWAITHGAFYAGGPTDSFAARLLATIDIPATGSWTFNLGSDEAACLLIDGEEVVYDGATHSFRWTAGTVTLDAGPHDFEVRYLERSWSAGLTVTWEGPTVPSEEVIPSSALTPRSLVETPGTGLRAFWTSGVSHATRLGYIDWYDYDTTTIVDNVSWRITHDAFYDGGPTDSFACRLMGTIEIPATGGWTFSLGSDEAASLLIDGEEVVYDGTTHSYRWASGSKTLSAGPHAIEIRYLERSWSAGLFLAWQGPGDTHESVVPASALTPASESDFGDGGGGGLTAYWNSGVSHATRLGQVDWEIYDHTTTVENLSWRLTHDAFYLGGPTDSFGGRFYGTILVPETGTWQFHLGSDEAAEVLIDGVSVALDNEAHSFRWQVGTVDLVAGLHTIDVRHLERSWSSGLFLAWQGPSDDHPEVVPSSVFTAGAPTFASENGIRAKWFGSGGASTLDGVTWTNPLENTEEPNVSWKLTNSTFYDGGLSDNIAVRCTGTLVIPTSGWWTFGLGSDEAADLTIDGSLVVSDPSSHSFRWEESTVYLEAGNHPLVLRHLERSWSAGLVLTWRGPDDAHESVIPASAFRPVGRLRMVRWQEVDPNE